MTNPNSQGASGTKTDNVLKLESVPNMSVDELKAYIPKIIGWVRKRVGIAEVKALRDRLISIGSSDANIDLIKALTEEEVFTTIHKRICGTLKGPEDSSGNQNFEIDFTSRVKVGEKPKAEPVAAEPKAEVNVKPKAEPDPVPSGPAVSLEQYFAGVSTIEDLMHMLDYTSSRKKLERVKRIMKSFDQPFSEDFLGKLELKEAEVKALEGKAKRSASANKGVRTKELKNGPRKIVTVEYRHSSYSTVTAEVEVRFEKNKKGKDVVKIISVTGGEIKGIVKGREYPKRFDSIPAALRDALYSDMAKKHKDDLAKARVKRLTDKSGDIFRECAMQDAREKQARKEKQAEKGKGGKGKKGKKNQKQKQNGRSRKAA
jgi:hypothetical protein